MEVKVIVLPGGKLQIFVDGQVSFEQATQITKTVLAQLNAAGIEISEVGPVEQHKDGAEHVHIAGNVHVQQ